MTAAHIAMIAALQPAGVTLAPDGDAAGRRAADTWQRALVRAGLETSLAQIAEGADPAVALSRGLRIGL